jgi:hypothetical protein
MNSFVWDVKLARRSDWRNPRQALMNLCYYSTRWFAFAFGIAAVASVTIPQNDCTIIPRLYSVLAAGTILSYSTVFAWRVIALWSYNKRIVAT